MKILIAYGTTEGQTKKIADVCASHLEKAGHETRVADISQIPSDFDVSAFDAAVVAASVHQWQHQTEAVDFVINHRDWLAARPAAFISVSLSAAFEDDKAEAQLYIDQFIDETGWEPTCSLSAAGALRYKEYDFMRRWTMRLMAGAKGAPTDATRDYEYTDWDALRRFLDEFMDRAGQG